MTILGYHQFHSKTMFDLASRSFKIASLQNKPDDPLIFNIKDSSNTEFNYWNFSEENVLNFDSSFDQFYPVNKSVFINKSNFLTAEILDLKQIFKCNTFNIFKRPPIRNLDERLDLGYLNVAISNYGITFSFYEHLKHKILIDNNNEIEIIFDPNKLVYKQVDILIGTLLAPIQVKSVHVFPKNSIWESRTYDDFS